MAFICQYCSKPFDIRKSREQHEKTHVSVRDGAFRCDVCDQSFTRGSGLKGHQKSQRHRMNGKICLNFVMSDIIMSAISNGTICVAYESNILVFYGPPFVLRFQLRVLLVNCRRRRSWLDLPTLLRLHPRPLHHVGWSKPRRQSASVRAESVSTCDECDIMYKQKNKIDKHR